MNGRYLFQVGDRVRYGEVQERIGTITKLLTESEGFPEYRLDPNNPWYHIDWGTGVDGFEYESSLLPVYVNPRPNLFIRKVFETDRELWMKILNTVEEENHLYL